MSVDQLLPDQLLPDQLPLDQLLPDQLLPSHPKLDQLDPDQLLPDQLLPDQLLPDHDDPYQPWPDQDDPLNIPPRHARPFASAEARAGVFTLLPKMSRSPASTLPSWSNALSPLRDPSRLPVPVESVKFWTLCDTLAFSALARFSSPLPRRLVGPCMEAAVPVSKDFT